MEKNIWTVYLCFWLAVAGAALGSFVNCAASRWVKGQHPFAGRSRCDCCGRRLAVRDLLPVVSYLLNRGKCRYCASQIPIDCLAAELVGAMVWACLGWHFGRGENWLELAEWLPAAGLLLAVALTDWHGRLIPDKILLLLLVNRALWFFPLASPLEAPVAGLIFRQMLNLFVPALLLVGVLLGEVFLERELMGGGDIKLLFVLAFYFNWAGQLLVLFAACGLGLLGAALFKQKALPFGSYLAAACLLVVCWGAPVIEWYMGLF